MRRTVATGLSTEPVLTEHTHNGQGLCSVLSLNELILCSRDLFQGGTGTYFCFTGEATEAQRSVILGGWEGCSIRVSQGEARNGLVLRGPAQLSGSPD